MRQQATMLLVDDDSTFVADLKPLLVRSGYTVVTALQGDTALEYLHHQHADIVVSDVNMPPGINGHELLQRLRAEQNSIPVILMSSQPLHNHSGVATSLADDYLKKPFGIDDLVAHVEVLLSRRTADAPIHQSCAIMNQPMTEGSNVTNRGVKIMSKTFISTVPLILGIIVAIIFQLTPGILFQDSTQVTINISYLAIGIGFVLSLIMLGVMVLRNRQETQWGGENRQLQIDAERRIADAQASADSRVSRLENDSQQQIASLTQQITELQTREEQSQLDAKSQNTRLNDEAAEAVRQAEEKATEAGHQAEQKATKARHDFYKRLDHEVKQPLQRLQSAADNLYRSVGITQGEPKAYYGRITNEIKQVDSMIEDLRKLAEMASDKQPFSPERLNVGQLLAEIVGEVRADDPRATTRDIHLNLPDFPELPPPDILGEPYNLTRVFRNLLDNAIKYTEENGKIRVRVHTPKERDQVIVEVIDNGRGIPAEELEQVWEEFYRASNAGNDGRGMGLALVRIIVERHSGERSIQRLDPPQHGTKVMLSFPAVAARADAQKSTPLADHPSTQETAAVPVPTMTATPPKPLEDALGDTPSARQE